MSKNKKSLATLNLTLFTLNLLFIIIATHFIASYWDEKGMFVAKAISMWLTLGGLSRHYWYVTISLIVILAFFITRYSGFQRSEIIGSRVTFWLLLIWSGILYVPIIYVQFVMLK